MQSISMNRTFVAAQPFQPQKTVARPLADVRFEGQDDRTVSVTGVGTVRKDPDVMTVRVSVTENNKNRASALKMVNDKGEAIVKAIQEISGAKFNLKSGGAVVTPNYQWEENKQVLKGYNGTFNLTIEERSAKADNFPKHAAAINEIAVNGGGNFLGVQYSLSERRASAASREALSQAYQDAHKKADRIAKSAGFTLDAQPLNVVENGSVARDNFAPKAFAASRSMMMESAGGADVSEDLHQYAPITVSSPTISVLYRFSPADAQEQTGSKPLDVQG